jgi:hypothetical protein
VDIYGDIVLKTAASSVSLKLNGVVCLSLSDGMLDISGMTTNKKGIRFHDVTEGKAELSFDSSLGTGFYQLMVPDGIGGSKEIFGIVEIPGRIAIYGFGAGTDVPGISEKLFVLGQPFGRIDPNLFAGMFWRDNGDKSSFLRWVTTHPDESTITSLTLGSDLIEMGVTDDSGGTRIALSIYTTGTTITPKPDYGFGINTTGAKVSPDSSVRAQIFVEQEGTGVRDKVFICLKSDSDTYSWVQIADGGA